MLLFITAGQKEVIKFTLYIAPLFCALLLSNGAA